MRSTQIMGLTEEAQAFLKDNCKEIPDIVCSDCGKVITKKRDSFVYEDVSEEGMFEDGPQLYEYRLGDMSKIREIIQQVVWSSGPCIFLCLQTQEGKRLFEWDQEVIDKS